MHTPSNMKIHTIIEKTALFISQQGGQMEIIIKMKQSNNPQFAFMQFDNPLYPYYRHLLQEIKAGHYKPIVEKKVSESDDEHHDDHYLHPSLSGTTESVPKFTVPSINFRRTGDDSYSLLVKNLKDRIEYDQQRNSPTVQDDSNASSVDGSDTIKSAETNQEVSKSKQESPVSSSDSDDLTSSESEDSDEITPPPPDVKPVIDKMAEYVAKNGSDFEIIVKGKDDKRFEFLKPGHKFYNYYMFRKSFLSEKISSAARPAQSKKKEQQPKPAPSLSLPPEPEPSPAESSREQKAVEEGHVSDKTGVLVQPTSHAEPTNQLVCEPDTTVNAKLPEPPKPKTPVKFVKGPISFSLKSKEPDAPLLEKPKAPALLMEDSEDDDEEGAENKPIQSKNMPAEKKFQSVTSVVPGVQPVLPKASIVPPENEEKTKRLTAGEMEAKMAEEKMKDKLAAAVRERLSQQKKDKQLQLERKQRAAMFLKMLQIKKSVDSATGNDLAESGSPTVADDEPKSAAGTPEIKNGSCASPSLSEKNSPRDIPSSSFVAQPSPAASLPEGEVWSSSSDSEELANVDNLEEAPVNDVTGEVSSSQELVTETKKRKQSPENKRRSHSKSHKSSSKKHKRSRSRSPSHKHKKSKSKSHKEKKLPAAYAVFRRSRSKSRSPVRYGVRGRSRSPPHFFNRWR